MMISNRKAVYSKFNHPAHCEGKAAALNGESHHNNPYDQDCQSRQFRQWNEAYQSVYEALTYNHNFTIKH